MSVYNYKWNKIAKFSYQLHLSLDVFSKTLDFIQAKRHNTFSVVHFSKVQGESFQTKRSDPILSIGGTHICLCEIWFKKSVIFFLYGKVIVTFFTKPIEIQLIASIHTRYIANFHYYGYFLHAMNFILNLKISLIGILWYRKQKERQVTSTMWRKNHTTSQKN